MKTILVWFLAVAPMALFASSLCAEERVSDSTNIIIAPFETTDSSPGTADLKKLIPDLLRAGLLSRPGISVQSLDPSEKRTGSAYPDADFYRWKGAEFILKGKIFQLDDRSKGQALIDISLTDIVAGTVIFRDFIRFDKRLLISMDKLITRLVETIENRISPGDIKDKSIIYAIGGTFRQDGDQDHYHFLESVIPGAIRESIEQAKILGITLRQGMTDTHSEIASDALIDGTFKITQEHMIVNCVITEREGAVFKTEVHGLKNDLDGTLKKVSRRLIEVIRGRVSYSGKWKEESLLLASVEPEKYRDKAAQYVQQGDYYSAILMYRKALEIRPDDMESLNGLASTYLSIADFNEASDLYNRVVVLSPSNANAYYGLGIAYANLAAYEKAISVFQKLREVAPSDHSMEFKANKALGDVYSAIGEHDSAISSYRQAESQQPGDTNITSRLAEAYYARGIGKKDNAELDAALQDFETSIKMEPNADTYIAMAQVYTDKNDIASTEQALKSALHLAPRKEEVYLELEYIYRDKSKGPFIDLLQQAIEAAPDYYLPYVTIGVIWLSNGEFQNAIAALQKAVALNRRDQRALDALSGAYASIGDLDQAITTSSLSTEIEPTDFRYTYLADLFRAKYDYVSAEGYVRKAIKMNDRSDEAYRSWSAIYSDQGDYSRSIEIIENGLSVIPNSVKLYAQLAEVYRLRKQLDQGISIIKKALRISNEKRYPGDIISHLYLIKGTIELDEAQLQSDRRKYEAAIESAKQSLKYSKYFQEDAFSLITKAYAKIGRPLDAATLLESYFKADEPNVYLLTQLATLYHEVFFDYSKAYTYYEKAYEIGGNNLNVKMNFAESNFTMSHFDVTLKLADEVLKERNLPVRGKLVMKMLRIASLLLVNMKAKAFSELSEFSSIFRTSQPKPAEPEWQDEGVRRFITHRLGGPERDLILNLIEIVGSRTKEEGEKHLLKLEEDLPETLRRLLTAKHGDIIRDTPFLPAQRMTDHGMLLNQLSVKRFAAVD
ncbi:tetratricopeptide repeat protein [Nitrospira sp. Nam80]